MGDGEKKEEGAGETTDEAPKEAKKVIQVQLPEATEEEMDLLTSFMSETSSLERKIQVERIIKHKLNPFEVLKIKPVNTDEELNMSYRKVSLMVHPDKCTHPMAEEAFEVCKKSLAELQDAEKRGFYVECWDASRLEAERELKKLRKQEKDDAAKNKRATVEDVASLRNAFLGGSVRQRKRGRDDKKKDNDDEKEKDKNSIKAADDNEFSKEDEDKIAEFQREAAYRILQQLEKRRSKAEKVFIANEKRSVEARAKLGEKEKFEEKQDEGWGKDRLDRIDSWRDFQNHGTRMGIRKPKPNVTEKGVSVLPPTMGGFKKSAEEEELDSFLESTTGAGAE
ncbi:hypothetical protein T484DRAFT_3117722 [Baffinella frigidus]|nr:hypothetical protein T484DRAFT_3117722 [Cryptophyta sp. CCMP2293]